VPFHFTFCGGAYLEYGSDVAESYFC